MPETKTVQELWAELEDKMFINTPGWTFASTSAVRFLATPLEEENGLWNVKVFLRPNRPEVPREILEYTISIENHPEIIGTFDKKGKAILKGVPPGTHKLIAFLRETKTAQELWAELEKKICINVPGLGYGSTSAVRLMTRSIKRKDGLWDIEILLRPNVKITEELREMLLYTLQVVEQPNITGRFDKKGKSLLKGVPSGTYKFIASYLPE